MSLTFNGINSDDMHMYVEHYPPYVMPKRKRTSLDAPGRTRRIYTDAGAYENVTQPYDVYIHDQSDVQKLDKCMQDISAWLLGPAGYCRLEDSYNPDTFRMAVYTGPVDIKSYYNRFGRLTLDFDCDPRRFLTSADTYWAGYANGGNINNPTGFISEPMVKIKGYGECTVTINGTTITLPEYAAETTVIIDCETGEIVDSNGNDLSGSIHLDPFPELVPGNNAITTTGSSNITALEIKPRFYVL